MSDNFFDSNVLLYLFDNDAPHKRDTARRLVDRALEAEDSAISFQVVQETLNVIIGKIPVPPASDRAEEFLQDTLIPLWKVNPSIDLYRNAISVQSRYGFSYYDSLIVSAALDAGCKTLYSEDMQHGQKIERLTIENPFR